jgi:hypothetical protein
LPGIRLGKLLLQLFNVALPPVSLGLPPLDLLIGFEKLRLPWRGLVALGTGRGQLRLQASSFGYQLLDSGFQMVGVLGRRLDPDLIHGDRHLGRRARLKLGPFKFALKLSHLPLERVAFLRRTAGLLFKLPLSLDHRRFRLGQLALSMFELLSHSGQPRLGLGPFAVQGGLEGLELAADFTRFNVRLLQGSQKLVGPLRSDHRSLPGLPGIGFEPRDLVVGFSQAGFQLTSVCVGRGRLGRVGTGQLEAKILRSGLALDDLQLDRPDAEAIANSQRGIFISLSVE